MPTVKIFHNSDKLLTEKDLFNSNCLYGIKKQFSLVKIRALAPSKFFKVWKLHCLRTELMHTIFARIDIAAGRSKLRFCREGLWSRSPSYSGSKKLF